ncbi:DUF3299 domain-containing protein [Roseivivax sp. THAF30]|jgi:hypothetical protein|uniref:DUF3299 domain-containing protein n=1 Tax=Roseivivax sp. THAF30 TaxID=2587852 RepID=UPI001267EC42|nr:DUF3299 domain-containing protein [Roseivivax sp. THAF30]QFT62676.1 hypothetical protein FIU91_07030 [Roseivivax sp. THAF30]
MTAYTPSRRDILAFAAASLVPRQAFARSYLELEWDDLMPRGVPYGQIIGPGRIDEENDLWNPEYDANGQRLNMALDGKRVELPGFVLPFEMTVEGVTNFMLVPYVGACIHTPPPPPNQLVFVSTREPWPNDKLWEPVLAAGRLSAKPLTTLVADAGYQMDAERIKVLTW